MHFFAARQQRKASVLIGLAITKCVQAAASSTSKHSLPKHNSIYLLFHVRLTSLAISKRIAVDMVRVECPGSNAVQVTCVFYVLDCTLCKRTDGFTNVAPVCYLLLLLLSCAIHTDNYKEVNRLAVFVIPILPTTDVVDTNKVLSRCYCGEAGGYLSYDVVAS